MTTKPKAERYRLRDPAGLTRADSSADATSPSSAKPSGSAQDYTARQMRMARRVAERHGLQFTSDLQAIQMLQEKGIDPFDRGQVLDTLNSDKLATQQQIQLPQKIETSTLPAQVAAESVPSMANTRETEIAAIQRDLRRRRRRNSISLLLRVLVFVLIPTAIAGYYYSQIATPMYATNSAFQIIKADGSSSSPAGLLSGTQFATTPDAIAVQTYLLSKDAMVRLDQDEGFIAHFSDPNIDVIQRLPSDTTIETAHKLYQKVVKIGFDPTEGLVNIEVSAADPNKAVAFAEALISYAEERVDGLSQRKRENQVADSRRLYEEAVEERSKAQEALVALQQSTLLDPEAYAASLRGQISSLEQQLTDKELQLEALEDNARPNQSRVQGVKADIDRLRAAINETQLKMTQPMDNGLTLAELVSRIAIAQSDIATRDLILKASLEQLQVAENEATSQSRYLSLANNPIAPQDAAYPLVFENTVLVFLILAGAYMMISVTVAILREQIS